MIQILTACLSPILFDCVVPLSGAVVPVSRLTGTDNCPFSFLVLPLWLGGSGSESVFALGEKKTKSESACAHLYSTNMANNTNN